MRNYKQCLKRYCSLLLRCLPPLPAAVWDCILRYRLGNTRPDTPEVIFLAGPDGNTVPQRLRLGDLPEKLPGTMRIVIVSDTHERHRLVAVPQGDVFLHCGDILMSSSLSTRARGRRVLQDFNQWLADLPCSEKVIVGGNHDVAIQWLGAEAQSVLSAAVWLQDASVTLAGSGIKVYGHGYSEGHSHNRAWQTSGEHTTVCAASCSDADVVITHGYTQAIRKKVMSHARPRLWASGHYHTRGHGDGVWHEEGEDTVFVNAAIMDGQYKPTQPPVVVDLPRLAGI